MFQGANERQRREEVLTSIDPCKEEAAALGTTAEYVYTAE